MSACTASRTPILNLASAKAFAAASSIATFRPSYEVSH